MENYINVKLILDALIFSIIGMVVFGFAAWFVEWITPFNLWDEIVKNKNSALAIVVGFVFLGLAIIIGMAHG